MSVREYVGARYVPLFVGQWDSANTYEPLSIVMYEGNSYTSLQYVPQGISLANSEYWVQSSSFNGQLEQYRQEVESLAGRVENIENNYIALFDTVAEMQSSEILKNGMVAMTLGFRNEGAGGALYLLSNSGTANGMDVIACENGLFASLVAYGQVSLESLGAYANGNNDDLPIVTYAVGKYNELKCDGQLFVSAPITLPASKNIDFDSVKYNGSDCAVKVTSGQYGSIKIGSVESSGAGIRFITQGSTVTDIIESLNIDVGSIISTGNSVEFSNSAGMLDCTLSGMYWKSNNGKCIDNSMATAYIGQLTFRCNRYTAFNDYAINIVSSGAQVTGMDFGYASLEGSKYGIKLDSTGKTIENVRGVFRVFELVSPNESTVLSVNGPSTNYIEGCSLEFDYVKPSSIENNITGNAYSLLTPNVVVHGCIISESGSILTTDKMEICANSVRFEPNNKMQQTATNETTGEEWKSNGTTPSFINTAGSVESINLPSYWKGEPIHVQFGNATTTVTLNQNGTYSADIPNSAKYIYATANSLGQLTIRYV